MPDEPPGKVRPHPAKRPPAPARRRAPAGVAYAELQATSNYTFLTGASHPDELVDAAGAMGHHAIAITDRNTLAGVVRAHVAARRAGVRLVVGARLDLAPGEGPSVLVYPTDRAAYGRLSRLLTVGKRRAEKGECLLALHDLAAHGEGLLAAVVPPADPDAAFERRVGELRGVFDEDRLSIAASLAHGPDDARRLARLASIARRTGAPLVATNDVHYHHPRRRALQDVLACIRHGCTLDEAGSRLFPNGERFLKPPGEMARLLAPYPGAVARTVEIADRARFSLDELRYEYPDEVVPDGHTPMGRLRELAMAGARGRYPGGVPARVLRQLEHELALIDELSYAPYFLTVHELVVFARSRGILCQGRGAAANSAVCYCLGVTAVDPDRIDVLFERFVSRERDEPPDIDIDFEHNRREEVIQHIYERYGRERAALTAEVITYRGRSAVRDVGKALGLSLDCVDTVAKSMDLWWGGKEESDGATEGRRDGGGDGESKGTEASAFGGHRGTEGREAGDGREEGERDDEGVMGRRLREVGLDPGAPVMRRLRALVGEIAGFPRHLSQHVGGFVITRTPLCELVPIENAAMADRTVIEWDKDDIDALGMLKVDCLGLGMLTCLGWCFGFVNDGGRDGGTKGRRDEGEKRKSSERRRDDGCPGQDVSGSQGVAAIDGAGEAGVSRDSEASRLGAVRLGEPDAACGGVGSFQHRGGIRETEPARLSAVLARGPGIGGGAEHAGRVGCESRVDADGHPAHGTRGGGGSRSPGSDPKPRAQTTRRDVGRLSPPSSLRPFVPPSLSPPPLQLHTLPPEDPLVYDMICDADTVGVFQIESRAQMSMLPRLRPRRFYDLVIEVAIVRPGPIQGDMVHPYLRRRNGEEPIEYPGPEIERVLGKTLGVPLFQEQAMRMAIVAGGFTPGEADRLRRAMASWGKRGSEIERFRGPLIDGMTARGYAPEYAERVYRMITGFSGYGFPESHAASFALLVYASAWMKRHHPAAFTAALINSQPMGFYAPAQIVRDAREHGVEVRAIDVNFSGWECSLEEGTEASAFGGHRGTEGGEGDRSEWGRGGPAVRLGMRLVKGLGEDDAARIERAARERGPFRTIEALRRASGVRVAALRALASADAFGSMGLDRQRAQWGLRSLRDEPLPLFDQAEGLARADAPDARLPAIEPSRTVTRDYLSTGLSLKAHPVSFVRDRLARMGVAPAGDLADERAWPHGRAVRVAGVTLLRQRPGTAAGIVFITLEDETGIANLVVFPKIYERFRRVARHAVTMVATGRVERAGRVVHVRVDRLDDAPSPGPLLVRSRDFH
jgi:error-prone DNA polymerase